LAVAAEDCSATANQYKEDPKLQGELRAAIDDKCVEYNFDTDEVAAEDCSATANQGWVLAGVTLTSLHDGKCLTYNATGGTAVMAECPESEDGLLENQTWAFSEEGNLQSQVDNKCVDYDSNLGTIKMSACETGKAEQRFYFEDLGIYFNAMTGVELAPDNTTATFENLHECRLECYSRMDCCGFTMLQSGQCSLKGGKCAPVEERTGAVSYMKTGDVSSLYTSQPGVLPDKEAGAKGSDGVLAGNDACVAACYKDKKCCGFADLGDGTCKVFTTCEPLKPSFGVTFKAKVSGEEVKTMTTISIATHGLAGAETMAVPWLALDAGVYKSTDGKMLQAGVTTVQNNGDSWVEVNFYTDFPSVPVLIAYSKSEHGQQTVRARTRNIGASKFELALELPASGTTAAEAATALEEVSWFAVEAGKGVLGGRKYFAEEVQSVDAESGKVEFPQSLFSAPPKILGSASSADGSSTVGLRLDSVSTESVEVRLQPDADGAAAPMGEAVAIFAFESPSMGGAPFAASPAGKPDPYADPAIEGAYNAPLVGEIVAPSSENTISGPMNDARLCLQTCIVEEDCHAVVVIPEGMCWLKGMATESSEAYPGARSYVKKSETA